MSNLLPCPFCGGVPTINVIASVLYTAQCPECNSSSDVLKVKADAITAWNTRQAPATAAPSNTQQAAAPDLYAALEESLHILQEALEAAWRGVMPFEPEASKMRADLEQMRRIRAALAKARGEASK